ncbi:MAG: Eco57I restriction-modification methylase domain-containing protein [Promethearchaeota archaeon]
MSEFVEYLKKEKILENLLNIYKENIKVETHKYIIEKVINDIENFKIIRKGFTRFNEFNQLYSDFEIFRSSYENLVSHKERKILGEFYTPQPIVKEILNSIKYVYQQNIEDKKIIDISCGSGSFLIQAIQILIERFLEVFQKKNLFELSEVEAKSVVKAIQNNIYGIDINPIACILCQINIHFILFNILKVIKNSVYDFKLPQFNIRNENALLLEDKEKYDFVIGNPPYLFIRDIPYAHRKIIEEGKFVTKKGQYDYYQMFIEIGINLLNINGKLGYIVPDSILALSNRSVIRKFIYETTKIKEIYYTGPKFEDPVVSNIILVLKRERDNNAREQNKIKIRFTNKEETQIRQEKFKIWDYKFLIHLNETDIQIIKYLNTKFPKLKDLNNIEGFKINISRGVELAKTGEVIYCELCKSYFPVPKRRLECPNCKSKLNSEKIEGIIYDKIPNNSNGDFKLFIYSIERYRIKDYRFIDITKDGINYKDLNIYDNRIIIRQLSQNNLICATMDEKLSLTSQSLYNLKISQSPIKEFNNLYLLGIINSLLLSFYFIKVFGSYKKLFPRILIEKVKDLPIKIPQSDIERELASKIARKVKKLLEVNGYKNKNFEKLQQEIDFLVFALYKISNLQSQYILEFMEYL